MSPHQPGSPDGTNMERREFLRSASAGAAAGVSLPPFEPSRLQNDPHTDLAEQSVPSEEITLKYFPPNSLEGMNPHQRRQMLRLWEKTWKGMSTREYQDRFIAHMREGNIVPADWNGTDSDWAGLVRCDSDPLKMAQWLDERRETRAAIRSILDAVIQLKEESDSAEKILDGDRQEGHTDAHGI